MSPTPSILLVDDDALFRDSLELLLSCSYTVHTASSAEDALLKLRHIRPAAILSDVSMPGIGGVGLLQQLPAALRARTAFMTAGLPSADAGRVLQASGQPLLRKPVPYALLSETLRRLLARSPAAPPPAPEAAVARTA